MKLLGDVLVQMNAAEQPSAENIARAYEYLRANNLLRLNEAAELERRIASATSSSELANILNINERAAIRQSQQSSGLFGANRQRALQSVSQCYCPRPTAPSVADSDRVLTAKQSPTDALPGSRAASLAPQFLRLPLRPLRDLPLMPIRCAVSTERSNRIILKVFVFS